MKRFLTILLSIIFLQSQSFAQLGFSSFISNARVNLSASSDLNFGASLEESMTKYKTMQTNVDMQRSANADVRKAVDVINNPGGYTIEEREAAEAIYAEYAKANGLKAGEILFTNDDYKYSPKGSYIEGTSALGENIITLDVGAGNQAVDGKETFETKMHELAHSGGVKDENSADRVSVGATTVWKIENFFHGREFTITGTSAGYLNAYSNNAALTYNTARYDSISTEDRQDFAREMSEYLSLKITGNNQGNAISEHLEQNLAMFSLNSDNHIPVIQTTADLLSIIPVLGTPFDVLSFKISEYQNDEAGMFLSIAGMDPQYVGVMAGITKVKVLERQ